MDINRKTTGSDILSELAPGIEPMLTQKLVEAIDKLVKAHTEDALQNEFEERLHRQSGKAERWYIPAGVRDNINEIADKLPLTARAELMRIGYEQVLELKKHHEGGVFTELKELIKQPLVDRAENMPFDFGSLLDSINELPKDKFLRFLSQGKISKARAQRVIDEINNEYKILEGEENYA